MSTPNLRPSPGLTDTQLIAQARTEPLPGRIGTYLRLLGPGWLQSALKLGGGTLTGSLYLGTLAGFGLLWVHPLALFFGIIMLWSLGYVIMCTGLRPFRAITDHVNPVLGWGWILAALLSCMIWDLPQYSMAHGVLSQNLLPGIFGDRGLLGPWGGRLGVSLSLLAVCVSVAWSYDARGVGLRFFDLALRIIVWFETLSFIGVVIRLGWTGGIDWSAVFHGFIPNFSLFHSISHSYDPLLRPLAPETRAYWSGLLVKDQRDVMIASAASAAGVNGTFLFGYSLWRRKWGKEFLIFSRADLLLSMLLPVTITSSCVVIAGAHQFHAVTQEALLAPVPGLPPPPPKRVTEYRELLRERVRWEAKAEGASLSAPEVDARTNALSPDEKRVAATLVTRDAFELAGSLEPLTGRLFSQLFFGIGILGMCTSSIILHLTICGMIFCEMLNRPHSGRTFRFGALAAAVGAFGPFIGSKASFWLAIPVAVLSYTLIPLTYLTFFFMMNSRQLLGDNLPQGGRRWAWNLSMGVAVSVFCVSGVWMLWHNGGYLSLTAAALFLATAGVVQIFRRPVGSAASGKR